MTTVTPIRTLHTFIFSMQKKFLEVRVFFILTYLFDILYEITTLNVQIRNLVEDVRTRFQKIAICSTFLIRSRQFNANSGPWFLAAR